MSTEENIDGLKHRIDCFPSSEKMEELIKIRYEAGFQRKENLDNKANNMMGISSTVATLFGGFGLASATALFSTELHTVNLAIFTLLIGVSLMVSCIIFSAKSYFIGGYYTAMKVDDFIKIKQNNDYEWVNKTIDDFRKRDPIEISKLMIKVHLGCILQNRNINDRKSNYLEIGQKIFFIGVAIVPLFILVTSLT